MRECRHRDFTENNRRRERTDPLKTIKPNTCSLGYALFLAINAAGVWGGVFPFLPLDMQTPGIMARFLRRPIARLRTQLPGKRTRVVFLSWPDAALPRVRRRHALLPGMGVPHRGHVHRRACGGPHDGGRSAARTGVCRVLHALAAPVRRTRRGVGHVRPRRGNRLFRADLSPCTSFPALSPRC